jgi:hypothetical protein
MLCQCDVEPNNYLVFEDAPLCVAAVKTAGMQVLVSCHAYFAPFNGRLRFFSKTRVCHSCILLVISTQSCRVASDLSDGTRSFCVGSTDIYGATCNKKRFFLVHCTYFAAAW